MESWRLVWRKGFVPQLSTKALRALAVGLIADDPRLIQGATTSPPPLQYAQDWPCEGACLLGYAGWLGEGLDTVGQVEEYFARLCFQADQAVGEPAYCRYVLNVFDEMPREEMRRVFLAEVQLALNQRKDYEDGNESEDAPEEDAAAIPAGHDAAPTSSTGSGRVELRGDPQ